MSYLDKALTDIIICEQSIQSYNTIKIRELKEQALFYVEQTFEHIILHLIYSNVIVESKYFDNLELLYKEYKQTINTKPHKDIDKYIKWVIKNIENTERIIKIKSLINAINTAEQWLIEIKPIYKAKLADVNGKINL